MENTWLQLRKVLRNKYKLNNFSRLHALIVLIRIYHVKAGIKLVIFI